MKGQAHLSDLPAIEVLSLGKYFCFAGFVSPFHLQALESVIQLHTNEFTGHIDAFLWDSLNYAQLLW